MGLSAFNRARELRAQMNEQNTQEEQSRLEEQRQADEAAAGSVREVIAGIDPESPDFMKTVIGARAAYNALSTEQKALVDIYEALEAAEAVLLEKLNTPASPTTETPPPEPVNAAQTPEPGQTEGDGAEPPAAPPVVETPPAPPAAEPKKRSGSTK